MHKIVRFNLSSRDTGTFKLCNILKCVCVYVCKLLNIRMMYFPYVFNINNIIIHLSKLLPKKLLKLNEYVLRPDLKVERLINFLINNSSLFHSCGAA